MPTATRDRRSYLHREHPHFCEHSVTFSWSQQRIQGILSLEQCFTGEEVSFDAINNLFYMWSVPASRRSLLRKLRHTPASPKPTCPGERGHHTGGCAALRSRIRANPAATASPLLPCRASERWRLYSGL